VWLATAGVVGQATVALHDALFVTAGLRGERNDGFTAASRFAALPSVGVSYLRPLGGGAGAGGATVKLRGAYGRGLRPARTPARMSTWRGRGGSGSQLTSDLGPESQGGFETGLDLLAGGDRPGVPVVTAGVTRFDQRASGLLQRVALPFGGRLGAGGTGTAVGTAPTRIENVGVIDNRGWEFETAVQGGPLVVGATATVVDSRVRRTARAYTGELRAGDRTLQVPRQTLGAFTTWRAAGWTATAQVARARDWINYDRLALARFPADSQPTGAALRPFWRRYPGVTHLTASLGRDVGRGLGVVVTGANLLDRQRGEPDNSTLLPGRTLTAGVRATF
jgi:iron complex outermembrane receptor protein